jgi:hypothetical protein
MGTFSGIEEAEGFGSGVYYEPGVFISQITECKSGETRDGVKFFCAEFDILESTNPKLPPGTSVSWWVGIQKDTPALKNIKVFIATAMECDESEVTQAGAEMIVGPAQPLRGIVMRCRAKTIITKKKGQPFTVCEWELYEGSAEQVRKMRIAAKLAVAPTPGAAGQAETPF